MLCTKAQLKFDVFEDLPAAKRQNVCLGLFHCINWFRELVSESQPIHSYQSCVCVYLCVCVGNVQVCAFAGETDADMKGKVILRLMNITELQSQLESCMAGR